LTEFDVYTLRIWIKVRRMRYITIVFNYIRIVIIMYV
jgi:hypothetical protein